MEAFKNGDLVGAKTQFSKAVEADANAYQAFYSLGVVKERLKRDQWRADRLPKGVQSRSRLRARHRCVCRAPGAHRQAYGGGELPERQGAKMPKSAAVTAGLAEVKCIQGDSNEAQQLARDALKKNPDYRPAMMTIARDHYRKRRLDLAALHAEGHPGRIRRREPGTRQEHR